MKTLHCGISGLPIYPEDDILAYVLAADSAGLFRLASPPVRGILDPAGEELLLAPTLYESACARKAGFDLDKPISRFLAKKPIASATTGSALRLGIARADAWADLLALPARIASRDDECDVPSMAEECATLAAQYFPLAEKAIRIPALAKLYAECDIHLVSPGLSADNTMQTERATLLHNRSRLTALIFNGYLVDSLYDAPVFYELLSCENVIQETKSPFFSMGSTLDILTIDMPKMKAQPSDYADAIRLCAHCSCATKTLGLMGKRWLPAFFDSSNPEPALQSLWARSVSNLADKALRETSRNHPAASPVGIRQAIAQSEKAELENIGKKTSPSKSI